MNDWLHRYRAGIAPESAEEKALASRADILKKLLPDSTRRVNDMYCLEIAMRTCGAWADGVCLTSVDGVMMTVHAN